MAIENGYSERLFSRRFALRGVGENRAVSIYDRATKLYLYCLKNGVVMSMGNHHRDITDEFLMKLKFVIGLRDKEIGVYDPCSFIVVCKFIASVEAQNIQYLKLSLSAQKKALEGKRPILLSLKQVIYFNDKLKKVGFKYNNGETP